MELGGCEESWKARVPVRAVHDCGCVRYYLLQRGKHQKSVRVQGVCEAPEGEVLGGEVHDCGRIRYCRLQRGKHQKSVTGLRFILRAGRLASQYEQCTIAVAYGTISCKEENIKRPLRVQGLCEPLEAEVLAGAVHDRSRVRYCILQSTTRQKSVTGSGFMLEAGRRASQKEQCTKAVAYGTIVWQEGNTRIPLRIVSSCHCFVVFA